jgi:DNA-binding GntR family transcriptional regulator
MKEDAASTRSLAEKAYVLIRNKILKGEFPLGAPLSRRKLAAEFNMSFVPISDAIRRLEGDGLVESRSRVGTRVRVPTMQDVCDSYVIREALEAQSARMFCERASVSERNELLATAARLEDMITSSDRSSRSRDSDLQFPIQTLHLQLHMRIAECARCVPLSEMLENNHLLVFNWFYDVSASSKLAPSRHQALVAVLVGDDPDRAALEMGRHVRAGMEEIQSAIRVRYGKTLLNSARVRAQSNAAETDSSSSWRSPYEPRTRSS